MSLAGYLSQVSEAISREDGQTLRDLLKVDSSGLEVVMQVQRRNGSIPKGEVNRLLNQPQPWGDIVASYLQAMLYACKGEHLQASEEFREKHAKALQGLVSDQVWLLPAIVGSATTMRQLSATVDDATLRHGGGTSSSAQLPKCAMVLQGLFGKTAAAKGQDAERKRAAAVAIGCVMLKVYFRLNTLTNCKNVTQTIDNKALQMFDAAQRAHKVTYRYYTGRLLAYDEDYVEAEKHLAFALANCHRDAVDNQRKILKFLIPVRMLLGILPSPALLSQYRLQEYADIATAVRTGDVSLLLRTLDTHQVALVQAGTYLLLDKLQFAVYRRLFKKCALLHQEAIPSGPAQFQIPIQLFATAIELQGIEKDETEVHCLLANLIYRKFIKGYIAYKQKVVVLAKTDSFPPFQNVQLSDPFNS